MAKVAGGEVMYDQRLFNQDQGMGSGFGAEDSYGVYDKALFADRSGAGALYRCEQGWGRARGRGRCTGGNRGVWQGGSGAAVQGFYVGTGALYRCEQWRVRCGRGRW